MPIRVEYDAENRLLVAKVEGEFTFGQTQQALNELMIHPALDDAGTRVLWDMSGAALVGITAEEVQRLVGPGEDGLARLLSHRSAVVINHDLHYGIAREFSAYQTPTGMSLTIFRSMTAAMRYLDHAPLAPLE